MKRKVLVISGPTASFKTSGAIKLAQYLRRQKNIIAEIVNFDSLLFYRELNIGTAKPSRTELNLIPHHLVNIRSINEPLNASDFKSLATPIIESILEKGHLPILAGGSGFYLRALLKGMYATDSEEKLNPSNAQVMSYSDLRNELEKVDLESFTNLHINDVYRNRRALEYFHQTGKKISEQKAHLHNPYDLSHNLEPNWEVLHLYFDLPKDEHQKIIEKRTTEMLNQGLIEEVKNLLAQGFTGHEKPLLSIGYKEVQQYLQNDKLDKDALAESISISTRQLAKAQRTFFKKSPDKRSFHPLECWTEIEQAAMSFLKEEKKNES